MRAPGGGVFSRARSMASPATRPRRCTTSPRRSEGRLLVAQRTEPWRMKMDFSTPPQATLRTPVHRDLGEEGHQLAEADASEVAGEHGADAVGGVVDALAPEEDQVRRRREDPPAHRPCLSAR